MTVLKLKVSYFLLACALTGLIAATLPYPGLPSLSLPLNSLYRK